MQPAKLSFIFGSVILTNSNLQPDGAVYRFSTIKYSIEMKVSFHPPYTGSPFRLYNRSSGSGDVCLSITRSPEACTSRFVGAAATVLYSVRTADGKAPKNETMRELVTEIARSPGLPERLPFSRVEPLRRGQLTDVQLFGHDESAIEAGEREQARQEGAHAWRLLRQELHIGKSRRPFAVIVWKHTLEGIRIVQVDALE